jgi:hypothetical protein
MFVLRSDKETNKQVVISTEETSKKAPPTFSGTGCTQDPLRFLEDFEKYPSGTAGTLMERRKKPACYVYQSC